MANDQHSAKRERGQFNTLAEIGTAGRLNQADTVVGKGSELGNVKAIRNRAKRKTITQSMMLGMFHLPEEYVSSEQRKSYRNTFYCQQQVTTTNDRLYAKYCKNRFCTICCCIRKADIINRYLPVIQTWEEPYFVTLTVKAVPRKSLNAVMRNMTREFRAIVEASRKRNLRGKGTKLVGIRALESNFNPKSRTYNPHFHVIVANSQMAEILVNEWINRSRPGKVSPKAQKKDRVYNNVAALVEVVKYGSKIFTEPDLDKKVRKCGSGKIYLLALNNIFNAMKGLRIFERFGFNLPKRNQEDVSTVNILTNYEHWSFLISCYDWVNVENGELLTEYRPPGILIEMLKNNIDVGIG